MDSKRVHPLFCSKVREQNLKFIQTLDSEPYFRSKVEILTIQSWILRSKVHYQIRLNPF